MSGNYDFSPEKMEKLLARVDELAGQAETVRLKPSRGKTTVFDSKMGGVPYFPKSMEYPAVREGEHKGKPLFFLAQLNFGTLPKIPGFPTEGILQFFTGCEGDGEYDEFVYGMNGYDDEFNQNEFRVIYHGNIVTDTSMLYSEEDIPEFSNGEGYFPFGGEFLLNAGKAEPMGIPVEDFRFQKILFAACKEILGIDLESMAADSGSEDVINEFDRALNETICTNDFGGTRMGGYPFFTQSDPRGFDEKYAGCTVLLFQSDSENCDEGGEDDYICWGDSGVANFFISPEDLAKRDFSHVMYNWDCG